MWNDFTAPHPGSAPPMSTFQPHPDPYSDRLHEHERLAPRRHGELSNDDGDSRPSGARFMAIVIAVAVVIVVGVTIAVLSLI
jgi:hypothetical protein